MNKEIQDIKEKRGCWFYDQELQDVLLAPVGEVLGFLPGGELVGFLEIVDREEVVDLFLVADHDGVEPHVVEFPLSYEMVTVSRS